MFHPFAFLFHSYRISLRKWDESYKKFNTMEMVEKEKVYVEKEGKEYASKGVAGM